MHRIAAAAPSDITQISSRVSGQATMGALRTSSMVIALSLLRIRVVVRVEVILHGLTCAICSTVVPNSFMWRVTIIA